MTRLFSNLLLGNSVLDLIDLLNERLQAIDWIFFNFGQLDAKLKQIENENARVHERLAKVEQQCEENRQDAKKIKAHLASILVEPKLIFYGVPHRPGATDLVELVTKIVGELKISLGPSAILSAQSFFPNPQEENEQDDNEKDKEKSSTAILVHFSCRDFCSSILRAKKRYGDLKRSDLKDVEFDETNPEDSVIMIKDFMAGSVYSLLLETRKKAADLNYRFVWQKCGMIYARKFGRSQAIAISSVEDLEKL